MEPSKTALLDLIRIYRLAVTSAHQEILAILLPTLPLRSDQRTDAIASFVLDRLRSLFDRAPTEREKKSFERVVSSIEAKTSNAIASVPGLNPALIVNGGEVLLGDFRRKNVQLITTVKKRHLDRVLGVLTDNNIGTLSAADLAERLSETLDIDTARAEFWAIDQTLKLNADVNQIRQQGVGIEQYVWSTSKDERVRSFSSGDKEDHTLLEGQTFAWSSPPEIPGLDGETAHPGQRYRCRCIAIPVL